MRPLTAAINLGRLRQNYDWLRRMHGGRLLAVVKADAYGHGAVACAQALPQADGFAVAFLEEARVLREAGIAQPIVLLEGVFDPLEYAAVESLNLWPVIHHAQQLQGFLQHDWRAPRAVWLKMDSGMRRAGFAPMDFQAAHAALRRHTGVAEVVAMTHLACADEPDSSQTLAQLSVFDAHAQGMPQSVANSAGMMAWPQSRREWGRAGIALYGVSPVEDSGCLKPVMRLHTQVFAERLLQAGEALGYGAAFKTYDDLRIGLVACGYADGYPRLAGAGGVVIGGQFARILGRISMDMMSVELPPGQGVGSEVELWGDAMPVAQVAHQAQTIAYEVLCRVKRARFVYDASA